MDFEEAVNYYHSLERFGIRPGLDSIRALCRQLGDPQKKLRCVHVAGTNGKGSVCTEIASVLTEAGYRTGLYTSPYVIEFRERIRLNGEMIGKDDLAAVTDVVRKTVSSLSEKGILVTEFEAVTAAAFLYFAEQHCDIVVLETGLGGRFDATNVIEDPLCSIITSVSLDHIKILGDTVEKIAFEKSGIIKPHHPVITSSNQTDSVREVIRRTADSVESEMMTADPSAMEILQSDISGTDVLYLGQSFHIPFPGCHQIENASLVISAIEFLRRIGYYISDEHLSLGISKAFIPARIEIIKRDPLIILDGSHNESSTAALAAAIKTYLPDKKLLAVMGMMADKDCEGALKNLLPFFSEVIAVTPSNPRSMPADSFCDLVKRYNVPAVAKESPQQGVLYAFERVKYFDALIVCGSLYLASDVRQLLLNYPDIN